ncbi:putative Mitochondrial dicarboxylate carrier-like protein [Naja naja]|nr:putative Mitochondrial dicarboxylate carrier-like protein [Naja naja]
MAEKRVSRWYFGGLASCGAACCTHPLDLLKVGPSKGGKQGNEDSLIRSLACLAADVEQAAVHLQTQQEVKMRMTGMALRVIRNDGFLALYNGLSASLCRQTVRDSLSQGAQGPMPFYQKVLLGAVGGELGLGKYRKKGEVLPVWAAVFHLLSPLVAGFTGGFVGTPADMVNVRMQNDIKQPAHLRRNYSHALDGLYQVFRKGSSLDLHQQMYLSASFIVATFIEASFFSNTALACYDQAKQLVLGTGLLADNIFTHFLASFIAGGCATFLCQPLDVLKTRLMNSQGEYRGVMHCAVETAKLGPSAFYKGLVPAGIRLVPHTVLTFVFLEQLRKYFGIKVLT